MTTLNTHNVVRMEGKVNNVIQKAIDSEYLFKKALRDENADIPERRNWLAKLSPHQAKEE